MATHIPPSHSGERTRARQSVNADWRLGCYIKSVVCVAAGRYSTGQQCAQACSFLFVERKGSGDASQTTQTVRGNATELIHERCEDPRYRGSHYLLCLQSAADAAFQSLQPLCVGILYFIRSLCSLAYTAHMSSVNAESCGSLRRDNDMLILLMQGSQSWRSRLKAQRSARIAC